MENSKNHQHDDSFTPAFPTAPIVSWKGIHSTMREMFLGCVELPGGPRCFRGWWGVLLNVFWFFTIPSKLATDAYMWKDCSMNHFGFVVLILLMVQKSCTTWDVDIKPVKEYEKLPTSTGFCSRISAINSRKCMKFDHPSRTAFKLEGGKLSPNNSPTRWGPGSSFRRRDMGPLEVTVIVTCFEGNV